MNISNEKQKYVTNFTLEMYHALPRNFQSKKGKKTVYILIVNLPYIKWLKYFNGLSTKECTRTFTNNEKITKIPTSSYADTKQIIPASKARIILALNSSIRFNEKVIKQEAACQPC